ncbi:hypothetical protein [Robiginitalea sp. SC105]|uniref:hypothetical protein n=1 Tax=Robiginitalea sp. SC105 TaxID=2762332 RepID=UPI001639AA5D|nr:hypothetical protein [Robiginitalea sp. SC105]MBC2838593.1 hypothetical protein [Robiginitalea sp. SC105]
MKTAGLIFLFIAISFMNSCNTPQDAQGLLENPELRGELMNHMAANDTYMMEFMDKLQDSEHGMQMMMGNQRMMDHMMGGEGMQRMMQDSTRMNRMMSAMMSDPEMMGAMMQMMHGKGMLSEDCMHTGMQMMEGSGKGMMEDNQ